MSNAVYPNLVKGLTWSVLKTPEFSTIVQRSANEVELRLQQSYNPIWSFQLIYEYLYDRFNSPQNTQAYVDTDLRTLMGFFLAHSGQYDDFLFDDPSDDWVGAQTWRSRFDFNPGTTIIDAAGHAQYTAAGGYSGATLPTFNDVGGTTTDGSITWQDQGAFTGTNAQPLPLVSDATNPISAAVVGASAGSGFAVGDYLAVTGGGGTGGILQVATVSSGAILTFTIAQAGSGYTTTTGAALAVLTGAGTGSPTANITAATIYYSPLQRNMGSLFLEDITDLNLTVNPLRVWIGGSLKSQCVGNICAYGGDYEVHGPGLAIPGYSYAGMYLKWCGVPVGVVTATFNFYFRVRFKTDAQDFEQFAAELWTIGGSAGKNGKGTLELMTSRAGTV